MEPSLQHTPKPATQVEGGYVILTTVQVLMAWHLYLVGELQLRDVRTWLALFEVQARRRFLSPGRSPRYRFRELVALLGRSRGTRSSLRRLQALGLFHRDQAGLHLAKSPDSLNLPSLQGFWERLALVPARTTKIPLPRRVLRFMAGGTSRVETACILGHALRCLFLKKEGKVVSSGVCKGSWIAEVFAVNASCVRAARSRLCSIGLLETKATHQVVQNRWGARTMFNLSWSGSAPVGEGETRSVQAQKCTQKQHPQAPEVTVFATPLGVTSDLPTEGSNQTSGTPNRTGVQAGQDQTRKRKPETNVGEGRGLPAPNLEHILRADLCSTSRLLALHQQASGRGLAPRGERGELEVLGLAEHAIRYATKNAPGLFARLLREQRWSFITHDDEMRAHARLREYRGLVSPCASAVKRASSASNLAREQEALAQAQRLQIRGALGEHLSEQAQRFVKSVAAMGEGRGAPLASLLTSVLGLAQVAVE